MEEFKNEKLLNIIHFSKDFTINDKKENIRDITNVNNIIKNNISNGYEVVKMFGIGLHGKLYLLKDKFGKQYICKKLSKSNITQEKKRQLDFELKLLKYLSSNQSVKKHINPCINYHISNNDIFTIFPITDAISLSKFKGYLDKVTPKNKIEIVKKLVKNILQAISKIHKLNISHQNINDSNILVSINQKDDDIIIKFTEFGLGCGYYKIPKGDEYNIKDNKYILQKCYNPILNKEKNHRIVKTDLEHLKNSKFLENARKIDDWRISLILLDLIINNSKEKLVDCSLTKYPEYSSSFENNVLQNILTLLENDKINNDYMFYLKEILNNLCVSSENRKNSNYVLDNLIFYEKYEE